MAPTPRAGKGTRVLFNNADMTQILTNVTVESSVKALDVSHLGVNDRAYIPGTRQGMVNYEGLFDGTAFSTASTASTGALDSKFESALAASTQPIVTVGFEGDTIGRRARLFRQEQTAYTAGSPAADVVKVKAAGVISGRQDYGVWLAGLSARTSTGALTNVDNGAGTTAGGVGHFHMTAVGTAVGSTVATFRTIIQHSSAGTTGTTDAWATIITFSSSTGTTSAGVVQRSTVSGTVKRRTRAVVSVFTGATGKSATFAVAFARRNLPR